MGFHKLLMPAAFLIPALVTASCAGRNAAAPRERAAESISAAAAYKLIRNNEDNPGFVILDIRTPAEYDSGHIENAVNADFYAANFREMLDELDRGKTYLIYCRTDNRTGIALGLMKNMGFQRVYNMTGGIRAWTGRGFPLAG